MALSFLDWPDDTPDRFLVLPRKYWWIGFNWHTYVKRTNERACISIEASARPGCTASSQLQLHVCGFKPNSSLKFRERTCEAEQSASQQMGAQPARGRRKSLRLFFSFRPPSFSSSFISCAIFYEKEKSLISSANYRVYKSKIASDPAKFIMRNISLSSDNRLRKLFYGELRVTRLSFMSFY